MVKISVELPDEVAKRLQQPAGDMESSPEVLLREAAEVFLADREALRRSIARGRADIEAGRVVPHEAVMAELDAWVEELEARHRGGA